MTNKKRSLSSRAALGAAAVALAATPAVAASPSYSVKAVQPANAVTLNPTYKFKATGSAKTMSTLSVYIGKDNGCAASPKLEAAKAWRRIISKNVVHNFTATKTSPVGAVGTHYLCAYLTNTKGSTVRAHASTTYSAVTPGY
jgi:hypothetical protein